MARIESVFGECPKVVIDGFDADGGIATLRITGQDTWSLECKEILSTGKATNIKQLCRHTLARIPKALVKVTIKLTVGGNTWEQPVLTNLSNPEILADGFSALFRAVINGRKSNSFDTANPSNCSG